MNYREEYDKRQFTLMKKKIELYNSSKIDCYNFIMSLGALFDVLICVDDDFRDKLEKLWLCLDKIYDRTQIDERDCFTEEESEEFNKVLEKVESLIEPYLEKYRSIED
jgi:hypothetical protein